MRYIDLEKISLRGQLDHTISILYLLNAVYCYLLLINYYSSTIIYIKHFDFHFTKCSYNPFMINCSFNLYHKFFRKYLVFYSNQKPSCCKFLHPKHFSQSDIISNMLNVLILHRFYYHNKVI